MPRGFTTAIRRTVRSQNRTNGMYVVCILSGKYADSEQGPPAYGFTQFMHALG